MARRALLGIVCMTIFTGGFSWIVLHRHDTSDHVANPKLQRKLDRIRHGNPKAGYPGEAMRWYFEQRAIPVGSIPDGWKERALRHIQEHNQQNSEASALSWSEVGPANIGGRIRSVIVDPTNANILYAGSVSGGVFKTTNAGSSWFPCDDFAANLAIGALAIDPASPNTIYAGTGEGFFNADAIRGAGVLKSTNGGASWTLQTNFTGGSFPYYINSLYLRPDNPQTVYAATNTGLFRTTNGGTSWAFLHQGTSQRATQIVPDPVTAQTFYVCYGNFSTDGIYRTTNGGTSFTKLTTGLPASGYSRVSMAISPSNPQALYATFTNSSSNQTYGVYKSTNGGTNWETVATPMDAISGSTHLGSQGWYNNVLTVDPTNANIVYAGGINLYKSTNAGSSWTMLSNWYSGAGYPYVHADQHALVWAGGALYIGNDGGMFRTTNGGTSFTELNNNLATIQFYSGAVHPASDIYYGGTQDNGTLKSGSLPNWAMVFGGDGGHTAVDFNTPATVYTEYVYLNIQKSTNSGVNWTKTMTGIPQSGVGQFDGTSDRVLFIAPITMDPVNPLRLAAGTYRVFYTTNGGTNWSAISSDLTGDGAGSVGQAGSTISAIGIAQTSSQVIYVGTSGSVAASRIQVTTNSGTSWTNSTASPLPNRYVTRIIVDPGNADNAWALYSGFNTNTPAAPGHVFRTTNRGGAWTNVSGNLPDIPVNAGVVNPANINNLIVGTDLGIFETTNGGTTWTQQNTGLANVAVADLDLRAGDRILFAATHGRGMFKTTGPLTSAGEQETVAQEFRLLQNFPNPFNPTTTIPFVLPERSEVALMVYDITGRQVGTAAQGTFEAGSHNVTFDAGRLASGTYVYELRAGNRVSSRKFLVMK